MSFSFQVIVELRLEKKETDTSSYNVKERD